jgi:A/G-specific adenine glycosylase
MKESRGKSNQHLEAKRANSNGPTILESQFSLNSLRRRLLAWFEENRRELPWRRDRDPYRIWVSEVMLQQTQVATVIRYFRDFIAAFPTVADLAAADEQDVLRAWEGLGYYRRARNLHRAARMLIVEYGGIPEDPEAWARVPGVGRYIRNAVLSQAFDCRLPVVEANTRRVLARLFGQSGDLGKSNVQEWLWRAAETLLPRRRVGDFNQALMELGALVCTSVSPRCNECPLARACVANREGLQAVIPAKARRPASVDVREVAVVVRRGRTVLLAQRPPSAARWANMWEFPHLALGPGESDESGVRRLLNEVLGLEAMLGKELLTIRHGVTRFRITMVCHEAAYRGGEFRSNFYSEARWLEPRRLADYPVSAPQRRLARTLVEAVRQHRLF